jgi:hypothetical protein
MHGLLTIQQTAQLLTVDLAIVTALIEQGFLPRVSIGQEIFIPYHAAMQLLIYILYLAVVNHPTVNERCHHHLSIIRGG